MKVIYAHQSLDEIPETELTCFTAGPTPRSSNVQSWRPEAIELFRKHNFNGTLLIPEDEAWGFKGNWEKQIEWEDRALNLADVIMFWIPRNMETMPAMTTNIEFGRWERSGKIVVGIPDDAVRCRYIKYYVEKLKIPFADTLERTVLESIKMIQQKAHIYEQEVTPRMSESERSRLIYLLDALRVAPEKLETFISAIERKDASEPFRKAIEELRTSYDVLEAGKKLREDLL